MALRRHRETEPMRTANLVKRSHEAYIKHFQNTYEEPLPPIWALCEVIPMGLLSKLYDNLATVTTRQSIAAVYNVGNQELSSWLHNLNVVRNICAHHMRLWDRTLPVQLAIPKKPPPSLRDTLSKTQNKIYNTLVIALYLMDRIDSKHQWRTQLLHLIRRYKDIPLTQMGFRDDWNEKRIWQNDQKD